MPALTIPDDGFVEVTLGDQTHKIDAYRVYNQLLGFEREARAAHPEEDAADARQVAYLDRVCERLAELGFGAVSHRAADQFDVALSKAVDELGKTGGTAPTPASPGSTAPVPSP